jgi:hypothetical protein
MKRFLLIAGLLLVVLGLGGASWWMLRRQPSTAPQDDQGSAFTMEASGAGRLVKYLDAQTPLRAFRWLPPLPGGVLAAQVLSQNDRQRVALLRDGPAQDLLLVPRPEAVSEGFWRFAALRAAALAPGGMLVLLYQQGDPSGQEAPLALGLDVASQQVLWSCRGDFARLALTPGMEAVYLFGGKGPVQRVALTPPGAPHPAPTAIELPPEIRQLDDLLPTGPATFLVSHPEGLSAYRPQDGWSHFAAPAEPGVACQDFRSSLTRDGKSVWWQPAPGRMVKLQPDGSPGEAWQGTLPADDPLARDAQLLRALGADPDGAVWFDLARPLPQAQAADPADPAADWGAYAAAGLDRVYRWNPARGTLERASWPKAWAALNPPDAVRAPAPGQALVPAAGTLLAEGTGCAWWLPLRALTLEKLQSQPM